MGGEGLGSAAVGSWAGVGGYERCISCRWGTQRHSRRRAVRRLRCWSPPQVCLSVPGCLRDTEVSGARLGRRATADGCRVLTVQRGWTGPGSRPYVATWTGECCHMLLVDPAAPSVTCDRSNCLMMFHVRLMSLKCRTLPSDAAEVKRLSVVLSSLIYMLTCRLLKMTF